MRNYLVNAVLAACLVLITSSACALSAATATPRPTETLSPPSPTASPVPVVLASPTVVTATPAPPTTVPPTVRPLPTNLVPVAVQPGSSAYCADAQPTALLDQFRTALQTANGRLLASLISPLHGMDARYLRNGQVVNYDQQHAQFLFASTYVVDWGAAPGSGLDKKGSFHEVLLPDLLQVFNANYNVTCNQVQIGGASYQAAWPYAGINFYSVHFAGTSANGNLDWRTWLVGMEYVSGRPYLYALMQFFWEP